MPISFRNPWGKATATGGMDSQRADLWTVDLANATSQWGKLTDVLKAVFPSQMQSINVDNLVYTTTQVSFPPLRVAPETFYSYGRTPFNLPGSDEPVGPVRIVFRHTVNSSDVYTIMELWKELGRAGRPGFYYDGTKTLLPKGFSYSAPFRFDLSVDFYKGVDPNTVSFDTNGTTLQDTNNIDTIFGSSSYTIQPSSRYILKACWCSLVQLSELNQETGNQFVQVQTEVFPRYILDASKDLSSAI